MAGKRPRKPSEGMRWADSAGVIWTYHSGSWVIDRIADAWSAGVELSSPTGIVGCEYPSNWIYTPPVAPVKQPLPRFGINRGKTFAERMQARIDRRS